MSLLSGFFGAVASIRQRLMSLLTFQPANEFSISIYEPYSFTGNVAKNRIWYRGEPSELFQFYKNSGAGNLGDGVNRSRFWAAVPSRGMQIRKIHSGLPAMVVDKIADIVVTDMQPVEFDGDNAEDAQTRWEAIASENRWVELVRHACVETDVAGDGAFKISFDPAISPLPVVEFYSGEQVDYTVERGRVTEVVFYTVKNYSGRTYQLAETYGMGYVRYALYDQMGVPHDMATFPDLASLQPVQWPEKVLWAVPLLFARSPTFTNRGRSAFDGKCDMFDALDEDISQWTDAVRAGRASRYIPEDLIPRDVNTGSPIEPNPFDNQFIATRGSISEGDNGQVQVVAPTIQSDAYQQKYTVDLDLALIGLLSPSTLGIDMAKKENADAQREKEKTTLYSRAKRVAVLEKTLPLLAQTVLQAQDIAAGQFAGQYTCTVSWGEYANPSFESVVATIAQARTAQVMSIERAVEELYGDSMTAEEKAAEVTRIKNEQGVTPAPDPSASGVGDLGA